MPTVPALSQATGDPERGNYGLVLSGQDRRSQFGSGDYLMSEVPEKLAAIEARYKDAEIARLDGVSVDYPDWHFNVRASNTEPLLRLNLEAATPELMEKRRDEVLQVIRG